jgi:hypothetical protein
MQESIAGNTTIGHRNLIYIELCFLLQIKMETMYCEPKIFTFLTSSLQESLLLEFIMMLIILFFLGRGDPNNINSVPQVTPENYTVSHNTVYIGKRDHP